MRQRRFSSQAIQYGIDNELVTLRELCLVPTITWSSKSISRSLRLFVSHTHPFLGATPDGAVYDPSDIVNLFVFFEIKYQFTAKIVLPSEACNYSTSCCTFDPKANAPTLKRSHI